MEIFNSNEAQCKTKRRKYVLIVLFSFHTRVATHCSFSTIGLRVSFHGLLAIVDRQSEGSFILQSGAGGQPNEYIGKTLSLMNSLFFSFTTISPFSTHHLINSFLLDPLPSHLSYYQFLCLTFSRRNLFCILESNQTTRAFRSRVDMKSTAPSFSHQ